MAHPRPGGQGDVQVRGVAYPSPGCPGSHRTTPDRSSDSVRHAGRTDPGTGGARQRHARYRRAPAQSLNQGLPPIAFTATKLVSTSCVAGASTNPALRVWARGLGRAWQSVRSCEAVSTNPALRLRSAHSLAPRRRREKGSSREQSVPRPEHAPHAIWAGQAARSCAAASTDWVGIKFRIGCRA